MKLNSIITVSSKKRDGTIKAFACADGCKQGKHTEKVETASQTAMIESIFITAAMDAKKQRYVAIMDSPGAFLHADNDETVVMFMKGSMAELMVHVR